MAGGSDEQRRGWFGKSGHTTHRPSPTPSDRVPPPNQGYGPSPNHGPQAYGPSPNHGPQAYGPPPNHGPHGYGPPPTAPYAQDVDQFGRPTYHHVAGAERDQPPPAASVPRAALRGTNRAARAVTRKVIAASKADGAQESGLTALIWNQVLSYGTDAMITVALAGTVFFGASTSAQRGNVLLYLLITMAPFAVVAPVIGPVLDRFQNGRRWTMAGTAIGRCVLALVMSQHPSELLVLYPCALGSLVLSKAYGVVRAAAAPRLVPRGMTLTEANARLSIFGLGSTLVLGGFVGVVIKVTGSYSLGLILTAVGFATCAFFAFRLPRQVDSAAAPPRPHDGVSRPRTADRPPLVRRLIAWAGRGFQPHLVAALQGESVLRLLSGLLTIYLAFYVESTAHGLAAALQLGAVVGAAGAGNAIGTAIGTKIKLHRPELVIVISTIVAGSVCLLVALVFDMAFAVAAMLVSAVANALSKIALDALIQRDVRESLRSSAFARSETFLQLSWVIGAAIGVALPSDRGDGAIGFWVAAVVVGAVAVLVTLRRRALDPVREGRLQAPGSVGRDPEPR